MPTLLSMCTEVLDDISSFVTPVYLFQNNDDTAKQLIAIAKKVGRELVRQDWRWNEKEATITTVASTESYALPSDFRCMISETMWNSTEEEPLYGQQTPTEWAVRKNYPIVTNDEYAFRIKGNLIYINPIPDSVMTLKYDYRSNSYCTNSLGVAQSEWIADNDIPSLPEDAFLAGIAYYFRKGNGLSYTDQEAEYQTILNDVDSINKPSRKITRCAMPLNGLYIPNTSDAVTDYD